MSLVDSFNLNDYETDEELCEAMEALDGELETLRGFYRGASAKLGELRRKAEESQS